MNGNFNEFWKEMIKDSNNCQFCFEVACKSEFFLCELVRNEGRCHLRE